jgi:hypothetical protein
MTPVYTPGREEPVTSFASELHERSGAKESAKSREDRRMILKRYEGPG